MSTARDQVLGRVRLALGEAPRGVDVPRDYRSAPPPHDLVPLFVERLQDYKAEVVQCTLEEIGQALAAVLLRVGCRTLLVPDGLVSEWTRELGPEIRLISDAPLSASELDQIDSVVTSCALAVAVTGTIVLDHGPGQGRRALSLVPDHHVVVVRGDQVVAGVVDAVAALDPVRPMTWISGPSATSDIELNRVEGVHGPRRLAVLVVV